MELTTGDGPLRDDRPPRELRLVVGFDDSESARRALAWGADLLRGGRGTLHVIYADRVLIASDLPGFARAGMDRARDEKAARVAATAAHIAATAGVPHIFERRGESPANAILIAAGLQDAAEPCAGEPGQLARRRKHGAWRRPAMAVVRRRAAEAPARR